MELSNIVVNENGLLTYIKNGYVIKSMHIVGIVFNGNECRFVCKITDSKKEK
jgi:hypothetical protein